MGNAPFPSITVMLNLFQRPSCITRWQEKQPCVYILASARYGTLYVGTLYIGLTSDLVGRLWQHRNEVIAGSTSRHAVHRLVYYELFGDVERAIAREKRLKTWRRQRKINLADEANPHRADLAVALGLPPLAPGERRDGC